MFVVTNWAKPLNVDISGLKNLTAYHARIAARPSAQAAMKHEGLTK
jgi:glutathione S-transferase